MSDFLTPTPIGDAVKRSIADALHAVPEGKRGALLVLVDEHGARAMVAAKFGDGRWKVAAGTSVPWDSRRPEGYVAVEGSW